MYYNPSCSKCLYALEFLKEKGISPKLIEYLSDVPTVAELKTLLNVLGLSPAEITRTREPLFIEKFSQTKYSDEEWLELLVKHPILIQRPILVKKDQGVIGRDDESLNKIL